MPKPMVIQLNSQFFFFIETEKSGPRITKIAEFSSSNRFENVL